MTNYANITIVRDTRNPRASVRRVDVDQCIEIARSAAVDTGALALYCENGGTVANAYKWRADADYVGVLAHPDGRVWVWATRERASQRPYGTPMSDQGTAVRVWGERARSAFTTRPNVGHTTIARAFLAADLLDEVVEAA